MTHLKKQIKNVAPSKVLHQDHHVEIHLWC